MQEPTSPPPTVMSDRMARFSFPNNRPETAVANGGFPFSVLPGGGVGGRSGSMSPLTGSRHKLSATAAVLPPGSSSAGAYNPHEPLAGLYSPKSSHVQLAQPHKSQLQPVVNPVRYQDQSNIIYGRPSLNILLYLYSRICPPCSGSGNWREPTRPNCILIVNLFR